MKKAATSLFLIFSFIILLNAQQSKFAKVIESDYGVSGYSIVKTFDGNYLIAGENPGYAPLLIKIDTGGNVIWNKRYLNTLYGYFSCLMPTTDSCYILAGSIGNDAPYNFFCMKIKENGDTIWSKQIDMGYNETALSVEQTKDNGYIIVGNSQLGYENFVAAIVKLDSIGNLKWSKTYSNSNSAIWANNGRQTNDGDYIVTGYLADSSIAKAFLMKIGSDGSIIWVEKHNAVSPNSSMGSDVVVCSNGFLVLCYDEQNYYSMVVKTDSEGNPIWSKKVSGGCTGFDFGNLPSPKLHKSRSANYFIASGFNFFEIDSLGNELIDIGPFMLNTTDAVETYDSGFIIIGTGPIPGVKNDRYDPPQIPLIKTDSFGQTTNCYFNSGTYSDTISFNVVPITFSTTTVGVISNLHFLISSDIIYERSGCADAGGAVEEFDGNSILKVSPNPFSSSTQITLSQTYHNIALSVYDIQGKLVTQYQYKDSDKITLNRNGLKDGMYFLKLILDDKEVATGKVVVSD